MKQEPVHSGKLQTANGTWWELDEPEILVEHLGGKGNGQADDSDAIAQAIATAVHQSKAVRLLRGKQYLSRRTIDLSVFQNRNIYFVGEGELRAAGPGFKLLRINRAAAVHIDGPKFTGASPRPSQSTSREGLIEIKNVHGVDIRNIKAADSAYVALWIEACSDVRINGCDLSGCASMIRFRGCRDFQAIGNWATSKSTPDAFFATGIQCESTNRHSLGPCVNGVIANNRIENYLNAQAYLAHAGVNLQVFGNRSKNTAIGLGLNAASVASHTDIIQNVVVKNNVFHCKVALLRAEITAQPGIVIAGGSESNPARNVQVTNNTVIDANQQRRHLGDTGGIDIKWTVGCLVNNNSIISPYKKGIVDERSNKNLILRNNVIENVGGNNPRIGILLAGNNSLPSSITRISSGSISDCDEAIVNESINNKLVIEDNIAFVNVSRIYRNNLYR